MSAIQIRFEATQEHQIEAVEAIVGLFDGLPPAAESPLLRSEHEIASNLAPGYELDASVLLDNLITVQGRGGLPRTPLARTFAPELPGAGSSIHEYPEFTIEMETGTGKTYVYLRAIHELFRRYGFRKFIVVVPSVAIFEAVLKAYQMTRDHFGQLYSNERVGLTRYDGSALSRLRQFATSPGCEVLVMTLDSFNRAEGRNRNNLFKPSERLPGERLPFQWIQETRPILVLDEPQNMESPISRSALATLRPLLAVRFSATHRSSPNLIYRLSPFQAFRRGLVKKIEVCGITAGEDYDRPQLKIVELSPAGRIAAKAEVLVVQHGRLEPRTVRLQVGTNIVQQVGGSQLAGDWVVEDIDRASQSVLFENGSRVFLGDAVGSARESLFRAQVRETVRRHLQRQEQLRGRGIKVLSLFFVDRVALYQGESPIVRQIFDQEWATRAGDYSWCRGLNPSDVCGAYFAKRKVGAAEGAVDLKLEEADQNAAEREAAREAYALIMQDKERLLSFDTPTCFIFAHSALREGWDNPNVFQICTLNRSHSEVRKRQEIGRGLRLCVDQSGDRVRNEEVNVLTVIANESYEAYCTDLQSEYRAEGLAGAVPPKPTDARRATAKRREPIFSASDFAEFWRRLSRRAQSEIAIDVEVLIAEAVASISNKRISDPRLVVQSGMYLQVRYTVSLERVDGVRAGLKVVRESAARDDWERRFEAVRGDNLGRRADDENLLGVEIALVGSSSIKLTNGGTIRMAESMRFDTHAMRVDRESSRSAVAVRRAIPNLLQRTATETGLTRATILKIFRNLPNRVASVILRNPEGFAEAFVGEVREVVAEHVAERIAFAATTEELHDLVELFPTEVSLVQEEVVDGGSRSLYDKVQKDSGVEEHFVGLLRNDENVILFFKFPSRFLVPLPRILGSYNPDWGVVRRGEDGRSVLHLIRETKYTTELARLRFPHERRKVKAAYRYFAEVGADYRVVSEGTPDWWRPEDLQAQLQLRAAHDPPLPR